MKSPIMLVLICAAVVLLLANGYGNIVAKANNKNSATAVVSQPESQNEGEVQIGGPFELTNQHGQTVTDKDLSGKLMLVFFGFTNCPDVCPTDLLVMSKTLDALGDDAKNVTGVFITVDPETDSVEKMNEYMKSFNPAIQALTGSAEKLKATAESYKVYAKKVEGNSMMGNMFNHSAFTYLMGKDGKYITHFPHDSKPEDVVAEVRKNL